MKLIDPNEIKFVIAPIAPIRIGEQVHFENVTFKHDIEQIQRIEAEPVKHAHWELANEDTAYDNVWVCSNCGEDFTQHRKPKFIYCPSCGAKMDEERKNNHE